MDSSLFGIDRLSPFVRSVKISKSYSLAGEWIDFDHVFTYIKQGEADFILDGIKFRVTVGDAILMPPFMPHIIHSTSNEPLVQYIFHFDLFHWDDRSQYHSTGISKDKQVPAKPEEEILSSIDPISHIHSMERMEVERRFLLLQQEFQHKRQYHTLLMKSLAVELLVFFWRNQLERSIEEGSLTKYWSSIEKSIHYIHVMYKDPELDLVKISQQAGISTNHLSYLFKKQLGITIHKYVTHVRIEKAKKRMMENEDSLTQIADATGFSSIHAFSRTFKVTVGMTASDYMAIHANVSDKYKVENNKLGEITYEK